MTTGIGDATIRQFLSRKQFCTAIDIAAGMSPMLKHKKMGIMLFRGL
jgi:hypothetical protein